MSMNELFETKATTATGRVGLPGTAELTAIASRIASDILNIMSEDVDTYRIRILESAKDNVELDKLIDELHPLGNEALDFMDELDENVVDNMLKSQQSKRSRTRSKTMTMDNYRSLLTAAIAENLIRLKTGKIKTNGTMRVGGALDSFTPARLEELAADQEALRREIRNIQSRKSIMKSKADFDESSEAWQQLLKIEAQLKDLRVTTRGVHTVEVDTTKEQLKDLLGDVDPEHLKAADSKELLARIHDMLNQ